MRSESKRSYTESMRLSPDAAPNACQSRLEYLLSRTSCVLVSRLTLTNARRRGVPGRRCVRSQRHFVSSASAASSSALVGVARRRLGVGLVDARRRPSSAGVTGGPKNSAVSTSLPVGVGDGRAVHDRGDGQAAAHVGEHRAAAGCSAAASCSSCCGSMPYCRDISTRRSVRSFWPTWMSSSSAMASISSWVLTAFSAFARLSASNSSRLLPCSSSASANLASSWSRPWIALCSGVVDLGLHDRLRQRDLDLLEQGLERLVADLLGLLDALDPLDLLDEARPSARRWCRIRLPVGRIRRRARAARAP